LEGTATYNFMKIEKLNDSNGIDLPSASMDANLIEAGKMAVAVQLNIGFPL